jgi:hypothetical protein
VCMVHPPSNSKCDGRHRRVHIVMLVSVTIRFNRAEVPYAGYQGPT